MKLIYDNCRTEIQNIDTKKIRVSDDYNRMVYHTIEEAMENKMGMVPSPLDLSNQIKDGEFLKPVRLKKNKNGNQFDLTEGRLRYWAWIIAYGWDEPVPALVWKEN
jgi:hypothetical protein